MHLSKFKFTENKIIIFLVSGKKFYRGPPRSGFIEVSARAKLILTIFRPEPDPRPARVQLET